jgi:hypothetical protein
MSIETVAQFRGKPCGFNDGGVRRISTAARVRCHPPWLTVQRRYHEALRRRRIFILMENRLVAASCVSAGGQPRLRQFRRLSDFDFCGRDKRDKKPCLTK